MRFLRLASLAFGVVTLGATTFACATGSSVSEADPEGPGKDHAGTDAGSGVTSPYAGEGGGAEAGIPALPNADGPKIYVSTNGDDNATGASPKEAVRSI